MTDDWRRLQHGQEIPVSAGYADQPYLLRADDNALVLICTTGHGEEGELGQHIVSVRSEDNGKTWSKPVQLEPANDVPASYAVLYKVPSGRIYAFYNHNTDDIKAVPGDKEAFPDGWCRRVDSLGYFVFKFSDDHGKSWSPQRYRIPVREFEIDRENSLQGRVRYFWNVGKPFSHQGIVHIPMHKVGGFGVDFYTRSEGVLISSDNLGTEMEPNKIRFSTLPDGDIGIRAPEGAGPIAEEHSFVVLSDGTFFCVFRTVSGHPACVYSRDGGHRWSKADFLRYTDGRPVKNPRAANFIWRLSDGRYLYWFHNHGGRSYADRNPVWCLAAHEIDTQEGKKLKFSEPEILFYTESITRRISYPDLLELPNGGIIITETEKKTARLHHVPADFVNAICRQWDHPPQPSEDSRILDIDNNLNKNIEIQAPALPVIHDREGIWERFSEQDLRHGFSIVMRLVGFPQADVLLDNRDSRGRGFVVSLTNDESLQLQLNDGRAESTWHSTPGLLTTDTNHHIAIIIDGGPKTISFIVDGRFDDGGAHRQFGFGLLHPHFQSANGGDSLRVASAVVRLQIYSRALLSAEAVTLYQKPLTQASSFAAK